MKKTLLSCLMFAGISAFSQINTTEGFEGAVFPPPNWTSASPAFSQTPSAGTACTGTAAARKNLFGVTTQNSTSSLMYSSKLSNSNAINISFNYKALASTNANAVTSGNMIVSYSVDGSTWVNLGSQVNFTADVATCTPFVATIPAGAVPFDSNFTFRITGNRVTAATGTADWFLTIDDVVIAQPDTCPGPTNIGVSNITANTATVTWAGSATPPANGYDVYYSTSSTTPMATATPNVSGVTANSAPISGLQPYTTYYVWVRSKCVGTAQSIWSLATTSFSTKCVQALAITSTSGATVCPNQPATLTANAPSGATVNWYNASTAGNLLTTGPSYTTPALTATTNYYVSSSTGASGLQTSKATYTANPASASVINNAGVVFDALSSFILESITVYPVSETNASGSFIIDVIDAAGTILHSKTVMVNGYPIATPSPVIVSLDFPIVAGTNYKLRPRSITGISGLLYDPAANATGGNYGYPYTISNVVNIRHSTLTAAPANNARLDLYYYFYDWRVSTKCESTRQVVTATVDATCLGTSDVAKNESVRVYPNPFADIINIDKSETVKSIKVTDVSGRILKVVEKPASSLSLSDLNSGMYILLLEMKNGNNQTIKVIKK